MLYAISRLEELSGIKVVSDSIWCSSVVPILSLTMHEWPSDFAPMLLLEGCRFNPSSRSWNCIFDFRAVRWSILTYQTWPPLRGWTFLIICFRPTIVKCMIVALGLEKLL